MLTDQLAQYEEELLKKEEENQRLRNIIDSKVEDQLAWQQDFEAAALIHKTLDCVSARGDKDQQDALRKRLHEILLNGVTFPRTEGNNAA
ncbi:hypothetical protein GCM10011378_41430 [Hymenobacter glacieicola]|uniref:Uncharacterized protein n=2 Tax=Hymenobacter glacieicola TaxID=1562124 RepID=A0ABQ1X5P1_9BACT|nr:hypothetical protein GCM10011378_41430 [Hymenobacter glacieicola]